MSKKSALISALLAGVAFGHCQAQTTWNANADFGTTSTSNPNGAWSYGYMSSGIGASPMNLFDNYWNSS